MTDPGVTAPDVTEAGVAEAGRDADPLLNVPEIAERLGLSVDNVQRLCRERRIPATKLGGHWFLPASRLPSLGPPPGLDLREMARRLRVELGTARALCQSGEIPAEKVNGRWHITEQRWRALFTDEPADTPGDAVTDPPPPFRVEPSERT